MHSINPIKAGLALGVVLGLSHLCWAAAVAFGWGPGLLNLILRVHFIEPVLPMYVFNVGTAVLLIAFTAMAGFVFGSALGVVWNWLNKAPRPHLHERVEHEFQPEKQMLS